MFSFFDSLVAWFSGLLDRFREWGEWVIAQGFAALEDMFPTVEWSGVSDILSEANYFFPVGEAVSYGLTLFALWIAAMGIRKALSLIPFVGK